MTHIIVPGQSLPPSFIDLSSIALLQVPDANSAAYVLAFAVNNMLHKSESDRDRDSSSNDENNTSSDNE
jgi:hypothetical protein